MGLIPDGKELSVDLINPALDKIRAETVPAIQAAVRAELNNAIGQVSNVLAGVILGIQGTEDKAAADVRTIITGLDGWKLQIDIPPITLRLSGPKE